MTAEESDFPVGMQEVEGDGLDNPLRAIIVVNAKEAPEGEMEERMLDSIQTFDEVNDFFDKLDEKIAYPNEGHIKYEVGSDGLVVFIVDSVELKKTVMEFMDDYSQDAEKQISKEEDEEEPTAKRSKK